MKIIRASEVGTYQFCQRAWWYQQQGYEPDNKAELAGGNMSHERHGRVVVASKFLQLIAYGLFLLAIVTAITWFIQSIR
jgi:hypothetical protein